MRIVAEIDHPRLKITVFKNDGKFSIKFESGLLEQTYKFRDDERLSTVEDVKRLIDTEFIEKIEDILRGMYALKMETMQRNLMQVSDEFPQII
ncbi:MAG: hypothetical protein JNL70_24545 [Saprospiraceae bacterium]|nr:hypothetical protein [Saprospiraceae bacterium]